MAVTDQEKTVLLSAHDQLQDIASGLSGNRANELRRLAGLVEQVANGMDLKGVPVTLADQAKQAEERPATDFSPPQASVPAATPQAAPPAPSPIQVNQPGQQPPS